ncbi:MAG: hypothetical protein HQ530_00410 [Parcubacteria group bacterium]|nr:hypothetical protein [Parcubacteria group bacterium]
MKRLVLAVMAMLLLVGCGGREIVSESVGPTEGELITQTTKDCRSIDSCTAVGRCVYDASIDVCIVSSDADCLWADVCLLGGLCTVKVHAIDPGWNKCIAASDADCRLGEVCTKDGYCTAKNDRCVK